MQPIESLQITKLIDNERRDESAKLPVESLFTLYLNDTEILTFMASPQKIKELAAGFLRSAGVVKERGEIENIMVNEADGLIWVKMKAPTEVIQRLLSRRFLTSGCGGGSLLEDPMSALTLDPVNSSLSVTAEQASALISLLLKEARLYQQSGGLHGAALCGTEKIFYLAEDIGRHNAVDKVLGAALLNGLSTTDKILAITGRISSEMLIKAARAGVPIVLSRTSPTGLAVKLAKVLNIAVAGYVRPDSINVYCHEERFK